MSSGSAGLENTLPGDTGAGVDVAGVAGVSKPKGSAAAVGAVGWAAGAPASKENRSATGSEEAAGAAAGADSKLAQELSPLVAAAADLLSSASSNAFHVSFAAAGFCVVSSSRPPMRSTSRAGAAGLGVGALSPSDADTLGSTFMVDSFLPCRAAGSSSSASSDFLLFIASMRALVASIGSFATPTAPLSLPEEAYTSSSSSSS
mmetsp:Transcript_17766/g.53501  ORF Transcript_17766/g.53501 Transcript_17766/m.53501 type:complete len:204 (-) Transcript_17766:4359-4970(-)